MSESADCECCEKTRKISLVKITNPPALTAIKYRIGKHSQFKKSMITKVSQQATLEKLKTHEDDDFAIALFDGLATMADVLTFYQERIANEGFLRTATERRSVLELARAIGYELKPGVAASTYLVFMAEDAPGSPKFVTINKDVPLMSVPGQNEKPQVFETVEEIIACSEWNDLKPQQAISQNITKGDTELYLKCVTNRLAPGDAILLVGEERENKPGNEQWDFRLLQTVATNLEKDYTHVTWENGLGHDYPLVDPAKRPKVFVFRQRTALFGYNAPDWKAMPDTIKEAYDKKDTKSKTWPNFDILTSANKPVFNWNIISNDSYANFKRIIKRDYGADWIYNTDTNFELTKNSLEAKDLENNILSLLLDDNKTIATLQINDKIDVFIKTKENLLYRPMVYLDTIYPKILAQSWIVLVDPNYSELCKVQKVDTDACTNFTITAKTTRLQLDQREHLYGGWFDLRETVVFAQSEQLELANKPLNENNPVYGKKIVLNQKLEEDFERERKIMIVGKRIRARISDHTNLKLVSEDGQTSEVEQDELLTVLKGPNSDNKWYLINEDGFKGSLTATEKTVVFAPSLDNDEVITEICTVEKITEHSAIVLKEPLVNCYHHSTVHIYANIALATHGEHVDETLGSGDGSKLNQQFTLKKPPLTYISATTPTGAMSTLKVYVNNILWQEVPSLYGLDANSQSYIIRQSDNGTTSLIFGDGKSGARLPTGRENINATYRNGIGLEGEVEKDKITLLLKKPHGIRKATNPEPASGAASPEKLEDARTNGPFTVLTLGRIVSLQDFENFAHSFSGVGNAKATAVFKGETRFVHITIAGANGKPVSSTSNLYDNLTKGISNICIPRQNVQINSFNPTYFNVKAKIQVDEKYVVDIVHNNVKSALLSAFSFENRAFGQAVTADDVRNVIQNVPGVIFTDLKQLYLTTDKSDENQYLSASSAHVDKDKIVPADLLLINKSGITLEIGSL